MAGQNAVSVQYPTIEDFAANAVGINGKIELIWQPLYDYQIYPTAGIALLPFFTVPQGQGFSAAQVAAATPKTLHDTNMQQSGMLPAPQSFWVDGIEVTIDAGSSATANLFANVVPSALTAVAAATVYPAVNDFVAIAKSGLLTFSIMQKVYYREGPLYRFPQRSAVRADMAQANNSATTAAAGTIAARTEGTGVRFDPGYGIGTTMNFDVALTWPALVTTAANNARIGVFLNGWLFRAAQ